MVSLYKQKKDLMMNFSPIALQGQYVRLASFNDSYATGLAKTGNSQMMYYTYGPTEWTPEGIRAYISKRFTGSPNRIPLVIIEKETNEIIGFAAFININREQNRLEIGPVWISEAHQGSLAFTESMYMMLKHAFEVEEAQRVEFTCDSHNIHSKLALLKIGATIEGMVRKNLFRTDKSVRDTVLFGIIDTDWPEVRQTLQSRLYPEKYSCLLNIYDINIRPSRLDDLDAILEVEKSAFGRVCIFDNVRQYFDVFRDLLFVAEIQESKVIGYALAGIATYDVNIAWILSVGVKRDYQRKGIGKNLMDAIQMQLCSRNCREIQLRVYSDKDYVIHFYEKIGYTKKGRFSDCSGNGNIMQLLL